MNPILTKILGIVAAVLSLSLFSAHALSPVAPGKLPPWVGPRIVLPPVFVNEKPIQLQSLRIAGDVTGASASTEIDMTFFNPNQRILEGELQFPLLDDQSIAAFQLDVNGKLRDAVPVEKAKGQAVFEDIIRRRIDPGLLEVTTGNNFKLRVYPLPAQGTRRVVIRVAESLAGNSYRVPLAFGDRVGRLDLDIRISGSTAAPTIRETPIAGLAFTRAFFGKVGSFRLQATRDEHKGDGFLDIAIAPEAAPVVAIEAFAGKNYFVADIPVRTREAARAIPKTIGLVWDSSGSARTRDRAREFALLDAYFKKMNEGEVRLTRVRDVAEKAESFRIRGGNWGALRDALLATPYDGATNLSAFTPESGVSEYLLFTDGLNNYGEKPFAQSPVPLYAISAAVKADTTFLKHVAQRSGGRFIDLTATTATEAAQVLLNSTTRVTRADCDACNELTLAQPFAIGGRVQVAGILGSSNTTLQLTLQHPDGMSETVNVPLADSVPSTSAAQRWATLRAAALDAEYALNRAEIKRLGQRFRLVTRETSLIVLELAADYARFEIAPPAELREEVERIAAQTMAHKRAASSQHLEQVVRRFEEKMKWWNHDFPKGDKFTQQEVGGKQDMTLREDANASLMQDARQRREARMPLEKQRAAPGNVPPPPAATAPVPQRVEERASSAKPNVPSGFAGQAKIEGAVSADSSNPFAGTSATIRLQKWEPDAAYAIRFKEAGATDLYRVYLDELPGYLDSTAFYLDAADVFFDKGLNDLGLRVLSNLAEMDLENRHILRVLSYRLMQANQPALAIPVLKKVLALSPEEPQSYRDLGLAYAKNNETQRAVDTLYEVVIRPWHGRFPEVELITLAEMNAIIATARQRVDVSRIEPRLVKNLPLDLRAVLTWDADNTDIDLYVTDPNGERAFYRNRMTYQGGRMSLDFTGGYGPEEFSLKKAKPGKYRVEASYFGDRRQNLTGVTTLSVNLTTGFGTRNAREQIVTLRLKDKGGMVLVGEFEVK